jgi:hypothetical protein
MEDFTDAAIYAGLVEYFLRFLKFDSLLNSRVIDPLAGDNANRTFLIALLAGAEIVCVSM